MRQTLTTLAALATLWIPAVQAQEAPPAGAPAAGSDLSMGEPVAPESVAPGRTYTREVHGDWQVRCVRTEDGRDPCQLYQLLKDGDGNAVAEFSVFPLLPPQGEAVAGGTVITPLETLLTPAVTLQVDSNEARRYPFNFCAEIGCVARIGYAAEDLGRLKSGSGATLTIVPRVAPDQRITLNISLSGFTAGYGVVEQHMQDLAASAP